MSKYGKKRNKKKHRIWTFFVQFSLVEGLRRSFPPLGLAKGILDSSYLLIPTINDENKKMKSRFLISLSNTRYKKIKIYGPLSFILSFVQDHLIKKLEFSSISFISAQSFDQNIWPSFIYSFFCTWSFDHKLVSLLIYFLYLHTTIRRKYMVFFHWFFLLCKPFNQKWGPSLIHFFHLHSTIRPKLGVIL